jgi:murein L,D-transpeptidase YafK
MEGDLQVPEGFYRLDYFNPSSRFYLSMRVNYPNDSDRILGRKGSLGGDIMIHGNCVSIGCLAMSDERIQELWVMAQSMNGKGRRVPVYIFPSRDLDKLLADPGRSSNHVFWRNLKQGFDLFEKEHRLLKVTVGKDGSYSFE